MISLLEQTRTMCEFSCAQFDKRAAELKSVDNRFNGFALEYMRMTALHRILNEIMRSLDIPVDINLNTDNCINAINIISKRLVDGENIAKAISN